MPWVQRALEPRGRIVEWEGPPPDYLYHFTTEKGLAGIRRSHSIRAGEVGRAGFSAEGAAEGGVSFTDSTSSFGEKHPYWISAGFRFLRVRTDSIPGVKPVVYVGTGTLAGDYDVNLRLEQEGHPTRSLTFVREHEWWSPNTVRLRPGQYSVALPIRSPSSNLRRE